MPKNERQSTHKIQFLFPWKKTAINFKRPRLWNTINTHSRAITVRIFFKINSIKWFVTFVQVGGDQMIDAFTYFTCKNCGSTFNLISSFSHSRSLHTGFEWCGHGNIVSTKYLKCLYCFIFNYFSFFCSIFDFLLLLKFKSGEKWVWEWEEKKRKGELLWQDREAGGGATPNDSPRLFCGSSLSLGRVTHCACT